MLPLRVPLVWLVLGWVLILGVSLGSLVPGSAVPGWMPWDKLSHLVAYSGLMLWFCGMYPRTRYRWVAAGLLLLGIVLEVLQRLSGYRSFELQDMLANGLGLALGWWLAVIILGGWCLKLERLVFDRS